MGAECGAHYECILCGRGARRQLLLLHFALSSHIDPFGFSLPAPSHPAPCRAALQAGVSATVVDARFCKPLDTDMLRRVAREHPLVITVEEGSVGGFAAHVMQVRCVGACGGCMCKSVCWSWGSTVDYLPALRST